MRYEVRLPQWGMGMTDGEIVEWLVAVGDQVAEGDQLAEVETAKVNEMLEAPVAGSVAEILVAVGETAEVRDVLLVLETADD